MPIKQKYILALVTAPSMAAARALARSAMQAKLAACANLVPRIESHYWWDGKLESSAEVLILFKTEKRCAAALRGLILREHPYEVPEFITLPIELGSVAYLKWLSDSVSRKPESS